jgi:hypothetical protein
MASYRMNVKISTMPEVSRYKTDVYKVTLNGVNTVISYYYLMLNFNQQKKTIAI